MKNLIDYFNEISDFKLEDNMRTPRVMVEQNNGEDAIWNSPKDRWSRRAKHPMNLASKTTSTDVWEKGDLAIYEGKEVEISVPNGPNATVGIIVEGKTKMVREAKLTRIDEGVLGLMTTVTPLNRMMQLAGISAPTIVSENIPEDENKEMLAEADPTNMFTSLFKANLTGEFKNNTDAARVATVGQIMTGLESQVTELRGKIDADIENKLNVAVALGAMLIKKSREMIKPPAAE